MRRADREVTDRNQLEEILKACHAVHIGAQDGDGMFVVPMNYGYSLEGDRLTLYVHSAQEGRKVAAFRAGGTVAFEMDGGHALRTADTACGHSYTYQSIMGSKILALFLGLYLGFTFLLAAAAVLALQQLSQAADNQKRYAMLRRLGADDGLIARSASQQVALAFLMPLGLALIHSMVGMKAANDIIATAGEVDSVGSSLATAAVLILVYGGYFLATALACRRMARQSWTKLE